MCCVGFKWGRHYSELRCIYLVVIAWFVGLRCQVKSKLLHQQLKEKEVEWKSM